MIDIALSIASLVPDVLKLFGKNDDAKAAQKVVGIAKKITGVEDDSQLLEALSSNPDMVLQYKTALLNDKYVQDKIDLENVKSAREMHKENHKQADKIADGIMFWNLWFVAGLVCINLGVLYLFKDNSELLLMVGNILGFVINSLLQERQNVVNFFFGSSLGSKLKSLDINNKK